MKTLTPTLLFILIFIGLSEPSAVADLEDFSLEQVSIKAEGKYDQISRESPFVKVEGEASVKKIRFMQPQDEVISDYGNLRQIALVRHGEPDMVKKGNFSREEAIQYQKTYDTAAIIVPEQRFFDFQDPEKVKVFSSPLNRAFSTARYLFGPDKNITVSPDFREFESNIKEGSSWLRLPIKLWTTGARVKWFLGGGKGKGTESFSEAKKRTKKAAAILDEASVSNPKIVLTAHGFLNRFLKKDLEKMGWKIVEDTGNGYFGTVILVKVRES